MKKKKMGFFQRHPKLKKFKGLFFTAIALLILCVAYVAIISIPQEVEEEKEATEVYYLMDYSPAELDRVEFEFADGYTYTIVGVTTKTNIGSSRDYYIEGNDQYSYADSSISMGMAYLSNISTTTLINPSPSEYASFGLAEPYVTVTFHPYEGDPITIHVGDPTPIGTRYYAKVEGDDAVYAISSANGEQMRTKDTAFRATNLISYESPVEDVMIVTITQPDGTVIQVHNRSEEERIEVGMLGSQSYMTKPFEHECHDDNLYNKVLVYLEGMAALEAVSNVSSPELLSQYGLGEGQDYGIVEVVDRAQTYTKINISAVQEDGFRYASKTGDTSIFKVQADYADIIDVDYRDLLSHMIWVYSITDVASVSMNLDGEEHQFMIFDPDDTEKAEGKTFSATLDGKEIAETNARRLFTRVVGVTMYDVMSDSMNAGEVTYRFDITLDSGEKHTLELAKINNRQFEVIKDGFHTGLYANIDTPKEIESAIERIWNGEILDRTW